MYAPELNVLVNTKEQLDAVLSYDFVNEIICDMTPSEIAENDIINLTGPADDSDNVSYRIAWPYVMRNNRIVKTTKVLIRSVDELAFARECGIEDIASDYGMYCMNGETASFYKQQGISRITAPVEMNEKELYRLGLSDKELIVYGYIPTMISAQCLKNNTDGCLKKAGITDSASKLFSITDRKNKTLPVECKCDYCYNVIYNTVPLSLFGVWDKIEKLKPQSVRINFTVESYDQVIRVMDAYEKRRDPDGEYTRGHFNRGVE